MRRPYWWTDRQLVRHSPHATRFVPDHADKSVADKDETEANGASVAPAAVLVSNPSLPEYAGIQLTEDVLSNLTDLELSHIDLFKFDDGAFEKRATPKCKTAPGDALWPSSVIWKVFDLLTGGALIETVPYGSACYHGEHYDAELCRFLLDNWNQSTTHVVDPTSVMSPLFQGATCQPGDAALGNNCTLGGFPSYSVNITNVAQIQLAINFARALHLRLVVRNTGHDFLGKNTGYGSLSIWTHNLNKIEVLQEYEAPGGRYTGPAFRMGAGVLVQEAYDVAEREGYTVVAGECRTVGVTGGYLAGGGHSPVTSVFGLGSDQVLSVDMVTPDGRFITADETQNTDLFWAVRGGGPTTWGVVVSMTVKVHPKMVFSGMEWDTTTVAMNISDDTFWEAIEAYWTRYPVFSEAKAYGYCRMSGLPGGGYAWRAKPFMVPGMKLDDFKTLVQPLLDDWDALGARPNIKFFEHESLYGAWKEHFPRERVGSAYARTASRLLPRANFAEPEIMNKTIQTVRSIVEDGAFLVHYNINADELEGTAPSSANPAWRDVMMFNIIGLIWDEDTPEEEVADLHHKLTYDLAQRLKDISPGAGGYGNEGDLMDPEWQDSFYGENYERLLEIKKQVDPRDVFWAPTAVGSEGWYVTGQKDYVITQNGRLCRRD